MSYIFMQLGNKDDNEHQQYKWSPYTQTEVQKKFKYYQKQRLKSYYLVSINKNDFVHC